MLRDNVGIKLNKFEKVPIPVDVHVARATFALGVVRGNIKISLDKIYAKVRKAWFESVSSVKLENKSMAALDIDEPLWHLSRYGCRNRDKNTGECPIYYNCDLKEFCIRGKIKISNKQVELDT
ncbi:MAG: hypothetical protein ACOCP4_06305 [Candidatus Woesearchaeota archaeon]